MPTKEELDELCNNCYWKLIYSYNGKSVIGYIVYKVKDPADKGEYSSRYSPVGSYSVSDPHIFLPNAGYRYEDFLLRDGSFGGYWSSSLHSNYYPYNAYDLEFNLNPSVFSNHYYRLYGRSVRPVCP